MMPSLSTARLSAATVGATLALVLMTSACREPVDLTLPSDEVAADYYASSSIRDVELNGNVAVVTVVQRSVDLRRGGPLWAKMGPYIHIFSPATEELLRDHPGLAGVRVRTVTSSGAEVASVLLERATLNEVTWKTARAHVAHALTGEGAVQVRSVERLVQYGERRTTHEYSPTFVRR